MKFRAFVGPLLATTLLTVPAAAAHGQAAQSAAPREAGRPVPRDTFDRWFREVSNTGRWGRDDSIGTLNLITPAIRLAATRGVRHGITVSLARPLETGPNVNAIFPLEDRYVISPAGDIQWFLDVPTLPMHGWAFSHLDALSHAGFRGVFYNGVPTSSVDSARGASRLDIAAMRQGIVTRGVLIDLPRLISRPYLDTGVVVTVSDLEAWERRTGARVQPGDVVLIHTGREARARAVPGWQVSRGAAGLHPEIARWLRDRGTAALGGDGASDPYPSLVAGVSEPLHQLALVSMGMPLFDNLALEELATVAAERNQWTFLFIAAPLPLRGGSGSLVNALAVF